MNKPVNNAFWKTDTGGAKPTYLKETSYVGFLWIPARVAASSSYSPAAPRHPPPRPEEPPYAKTSTEQTKEEAREMAGSRAWSGLGFLCAPRQEGKSPSSLRAALGPGWEQRAGHDHAAPNL